MSNQDFNEGLKKLFEADLNEAYLNEAKQEFKAALNEAKQEKEAQQDNYRTAYLKGYEQAERDNEMGQEEKPAPVAVYMGVYGGKHIVGFTESKLYPVGTALYLNPPKTKTTVYMTMGEIVELWGKHNTDKPNIVDFARAIEQEVLRRNK